MDAMQELETHMRRRLIFVMGILVIACTVVDVFFFIYYYTGDMLDTSVQSYVFKRLVLPFLVTLVAYLVAKRYHTNSHPDRWKNVVCAMALETIAGAMSIFHSFFTPIWCAPAAAMIVGMAFHNKRLARGLLFYGYVLIVASACWIIIEHPNEVNYYLQTLFVVCVMHALFFLVGMVVQTHNQCVLEKTREMFVTGQQYRERLEYDVLTGVFSRRYMMERAMDHMSRCSNDNPLSVAILDIDNFKHVNDNYGHENGDVVLRRLGMLLQKEIGEKLTIGRFGGEEFVLIFEGPQTKIYCHTVDKIRRAFCEEKYDFLDYPVSFSAGFTTYREKTDFDEILEQADIALYQSKKNGKNRVTTYTPDMKTP